MFLHSFLTLSTGRWYFFSSLGQVRLVVPFLTLLSLLFLCLLYIFVLIRLIRYSLLIITKENFKIASEHSILFYNHENIATQPSIPFSHSFFFLLELLILFFSCITSPYLLPKLVQILKGGYQSSFTLDTSFLDLSVLLQQYEL